MNYNEERINNLSVKLNSLIRRHKEYTEEIKEIRAELQALKDGKPTPVISVSSESKHLPKETVDLKTEKVISPAPTMQAPKASRFKKKKSSIDWEKFIGENLISKIGILILIIGVGIGTKYSIDNGLLSPLTRIILGYVVGLGLIGFGFKLKEKYEKFSAVLVSGAMVINYFVTYIAYDMFELISQEITFALMVFFTIFTVLSSWNYKRQIIAVLGLVGAYAVPFLLSTGSGNVTFLFTYMVIINMGILAVAIKLHWRVLNYLAFAFTWIIYAVFYGETYKFIEHYHISFVFIVIFFILFYVTFLISKFLKEEKFKIPDVLLVTLNSFAFFGFGYALLIDASADNYLGLFTLANAILHFLVSLVIYRKKLIDPAMTDFVISLVLVFVVIAIPVQLQGSWVTILWSFMAFALFVVGRLKKAKIYEILSYPLLALGVFSLFEDWSHYSFYNYGVSEIQPFINSIFLTSILVILVIGGFIYLEFIKKTPTLVTKNQTPSKLFRISISGAFILLTFVTFFREIVIIFTQLMASSKIVITENDSTRTLFDYNLTNLETTWLIIYTIVFSSFFTAINQFFIKSAVLTKVTSILNLIVIIVFITGGLFSLSELRENYLNPYDSHIDYFNISSFNITIRYIALSVFGLFMFFQYKNTKSEELKKLPIAITELILSTVILWILTSELVHWIDIFNPDKAYKLGVSILWGVFSLILVSVGIFKKKAHLRIGAIVLFGITLIKLFFYDISHLGVLQITAVIIILGVLLLIISFLYNKFKDRISNE